MKQMLGKKKRKVYRMMLEAVIKQESTSKRRENRRATKEHQLLAAIYADQESSMCLNESSWNKLNETIINPPSPSKNLQQLMRIKSLPNKD